MTTYKVVLNHWDMKITPSVVRFDMLFLAIDYFLSKTSFEYTVRPPINDYKPQLFKGNKLLCEMQHRKVKDLFYPRLFKLYTGLDKEEHDTIVRCVYRKYYMLAKNYYSETDQTPSKAKKWHYEITDKEGKLIV